MRDARRYLQLLILPLLLASCDAGSGGTGPEPPPPGGELTLALDRAAYAPGEAATLTLSRGVPDARVRYTHLGQPIGEAAVPGTSWKWTPPATDYRGYLAEVYRPTAQGDEVLATIGIDVSSQWTRFPRYGFLSDFGPKDSRTIARVIDNLNRHHINGLQFYDWHNKHHRMLPGTGATPPPTWTNIFGAEVHLATVDAYIRAAHAKNMRAMFYNLIFGALKDAPAEGVQAEWYLFKDRNHGWADRHPLSAPFVSDIFLVDPSHPGWQEYLGREVGRVYAALDFDGFHMDQLGDRGALYTFDGTPRDLAGTFEGFIREMQRQHPGRYNVLNAVNQYGQRGIAAAPSAFLYTEVWERPSYAALADVIRENDALSNGQKNSVLAAYINYQLADQEGYFNTPSVLFADAVIFAFGGAHLELGEHMLGKEFFPNANLAMRTDLRKALVSYYDFLVAYQNLLRDGGRLNQPPLTSSGALPVAAWPAAQGQVAVVGREVGERQVIHLLNFSDATTMDWRDQRGVQAAPRERRDVPLTLASDRPVRRIWYATPDQGMGAARELPFSSSGGQVTFTLPFLKYWSMIVVEYR